MVVFVKLLFLFISLAEFQEYKEKMHYSPYKSPHPLDNELQQESSRASMAATMLDDATSLTISGSYIDHLPSMFDLNHQNQIMCGYPLFSSAQGEPICDLFANAHISTNPLYLDSHTFLSRPAQILQSGDVTLAGYRLDNGAQNEEHFGEEGTLVPATVLASLLASRRSHSPRNLRPFDDPSPCFDRIYDNQIQGVLYPPGLDSQAPNFQPHYPSATAVFSNELSLSLATSHSCRASQPSPESSGSTYLAAVQRILADLSRFSLENVTSLTYAASSPTHVPANSGACSGTDGSESSQVADSRKKQLKALLKMLDQGQDQCSREVRNVMSAFHPVTGLDPDLHLRFVLQTTSYMFKTVKERISAQILDMNARSQTDVTKARAFESSFIHKQWALQQLRRKEHQMWRPQRGLPEQSVSVLRSWMFQNFLHPYPKDSEKHMLAIKSGLTRSQVSNWFINARVRLWKPMIEEMYAEISKRKAHRKGHVSENYVRGHSSIGDQPFHCENETF